MVIIIYKENKTGSWAADWGWLIEEWWRGLNRVGAGRVMSCLGAMQTEARAMQGSDLRTGMVPEQQGQGGWSGMNWRESSGMQGWKSVLRPWGPRTPWGAGLCPRSRWPQTEGFNVPVSSSQSFLFPFLFYQVVLAYGQSFLVPCFWSWNEKLGN